MYSLFFLRRSPYKGRVRKFYALHKELDDMGYLLFIFYDSKFYESYCERIRRSTRDVFKYYFINFIDGT